MSKTLTNDNTRFSSSQAFTSISNNVCGIIKSLTTCENLMTTIETKPSLHADNTDVINQDLGQSAHEVAASLMRLSDSKYQEMFESARGAELLAKADEYKIPYNKDLINWLDLIDEIAVYETLLEEAEAFYIDWDTSEYDPVALQQELDYAQRRENEQQKQIRGLFYATRGLEV